MPEDSDVLPRFERFFIVGCQRTGTTLLRLILECHPQVFCLDERSAYQALRRGECPAPPGKGLVGFKIPRWTEQLAEAECWDQGEDTRATNLYRGEPLVFLLRDIRDTVASMFNLEGDAGKNWLETWGRRSLEGRLQQAPFRERFAGDLAALEASGNAPAETGAFIWKYKTIAYFDYKDRGWPVCPVRYEDLAADPERHLRRILAFLSLPWDPVVLHHQDQPHPEVFEDGKTVGGTDPKQPIVRASVGRWQQLLSAEDVTRIMALAGELNRRVRLEELS
jgi:Sulfotransferase family/Sulfotransferase domain